jgi:hypothetical protein
MLQTTPSEKFTFFDNLIEISFECFVVTDGHSDQDEKGSRSINYGRRKIKL